ncbi:MAG: hypothetical protein NC421_07075 [Lachnospiraceae bacterium]|nr:hypothetical protein [Lachnospiraceae bacterium]
MEKKRIEKEGSADAAKAEVVAKGKCSFLKRMGRVVAWVVGVLLLLVILLFCGIAWILTPQRLTPIVEEVVNDNISARFSLGKAELSVWSTFPSLSLEVDSLAVVSDAFSSLTPQELMKLPAGSDTLLRMGNFSASVNIPALLVGKIKLYDITLGGAAVNIVTYSEGVCNYDIFGESEPDDASSPISIPDISLNRFRIDDSLPIRYVSVPDSIDVKLDLMESDVIEEGTPGYKIALDSSLDALLPSGISIDSVNVGLGGSVEWSNDEPLMLRLADFKINVGPICSLLATTLDFNAPARIKELNFSIEPFSAVEAMGLLPGKVREQIPAVESDMMMAARVNLLEPYCLSDTLLPVMELSVDIPVCSLLVDSYRINEFEFAADALIDGRHLDKSRLAVDKLRAEIDGAGVDFSGSIASVTDNPYVTGNLKAIAHLAKLPKSVRSLVPGIVKGTVSMDASTRFRQRDLSLKGFHKIFLDGSLELKDIDVSVPDWDIELFTRNTLIDLGTNNKFVSDASRVDSLLTASVKIDTISFGAAGIAISGKDLRAGVGCSNKALPKDTMTVIPLGATIYAKELAYNADDTTKMRLRDTYAFATLSRFNQDAHAPMFRFQAGMKRAFYFDKLNRLFLNNGSFDVTAHLRPLGKLETRLRQRYDSIAQANPGLPQDSLIAIYKRSFRRSRMESSSELMDFGLDNATKRMLMKWNVSGNLKAEHGAMFTPYFPLRNRLSNFNVAFSTDSVVFKDILYKVGHSDFLINGSVKNLRRALAMKFPIRAEIHLSSDSLNVNELVQASYKGAAFAERVGDGSVTMAEVENTEQLDSLVDQAVASGQTAALLVPVNLNAEITVDARNIIYSDMLMHGFNGELLVGNGSVNLRNLSAESKIGSAKMTALYSAPDKKNIRFGFGLLLNNIDVKQFIGMMPAVDSMMPLLSSFQGKINADVAATTDVDSAMNIVIPSLDAAVKLTGDSLVLLDAETFRTVSKWLMFKNKKQNVIPHMAVEMLIDDSKVEMFPFVFDFDRYRLAVMGSNDLALNFKYHISVLKSPVPFKFGINLSGNSDKMKVRLGGAKYKPGKSGETIAIVDTARVNLLKEIDNVFRSGARNARLGALKVKAQPQKVDFDSPGDTISQADSLLFIKEGLIEAPDSIKQNISE